MVFQTTCASAGVTGSGDLIIVPPYLRRGATAFPDGNIQVRLAILNPADKTSHWGEGGDWETIAPNNVKMTDRFHFRFSGPNGISDGDKALGGMWQCGN
jgi:hypothetical protein